MIEKIDRAEDEYTSKIKSCNQIKIEIISITLHTYSIILCLNFNIKIFVLDDYLLSL